MLTARQGMFALASLCLSSAVVGNAYFMKGQFYPTVVFLTKSNPSMMIIYIQAAVLVWLMAKAMGKLFFGQLRPAEFEHLLERSWYAITETCLAFTIFRDDFSPRFVALFVLLLVLKGFHWLAEERVDFMERSPNISVLFHVRVLSLLSILSLTDYAFVRHAIHSVTTSGASVQMVFGFEYAILLASVVYILIKYVLHSIDSRAETQWENKAVLLLYTELLMSFAKVFLYATFMIVMLKIHTFPLFAIRPMYLSIRALKRAFKDVLLSRQAIYNMNTLYPDATTEELVSADNVCIICREEMAGPGNKKLPCNHIFHATCLRSWFQRQQTCPTCRSDVLNVDRPNPAVPRVNVQNDPNQAPQVQNNAVMGMVNPVNLPNLQAMFATWPLLNQVPNLNPNAENPQNEAAGANAPRNANQPANEGANRFGATPLPPPPFHIIPPVFVPPPPPIIPTGIDLNSFSDDELRLMEGNDRKAVELRLQNLRNIQILLDSAVNMMTQYNASWEVAQKSRTTSTSTQTSTVPTKPQAEAEVGEVCSSQSKENGAAENQPASRETNAGELDQNEIRRRRLEKLDDNQASRPHTPDAGSSGEGSSHR